MRLVKMQVTFCVATWNKAAELIRARQKVGAHFAI